MSSTLTERLVVTSPEDMTTEDFAKHMSIRHRHSLGGLTHLDLDHQSEPVEDAWRAFHDRLHALSVDLPHSHVRRSRAA